MALVSATMSHQVSQYEGTNKHKCKYTKGKCKAIHARDFEANVKKYFYILRQNTSSQAQVVYIAQDMRWS